MPARIIDGVAIAATLRSELRERVTDHIARGGTQPKLAVVLASDSEADRTFAEHKVRDGAAVGIAVEVVALPADITSQALIAAVERLNHDPTVSGILVQTPLPPSIDVAATMASVAAAKDIDGLTPLHLGLLLQGRPRFVPATAAAVLELLRRGDVATDGAHAVIVGRSADLALPLAMLLAEKSGPNATVTIAGEDITDLAAVTRTADILVSTLSRARAIGREHVKPGAVIIDAGLSVIPGETPGARYRVMGDVDRDAVRDLASAIVPAPGGTGPVTIAMLLANTLAAAGGR